MITNVDLLLQLGYGELNPLQIKQILNQLNQLMNNLQERVKTLESEIQSLSKDRPRLGRPARTDV